jgi:AcrR family transcriptional regulator
MTKHTRKEEILAAALKVATESGLAAVSGKKIANVLGVSRPAVAYHTVSMPGLRKDVMREAIRLEVLTVIAQGLAIGDPIAQAAPEALRRRAAEGLVG